MAPPSSSVLRLCSSLNVVKWIYWPRCHENHPDTTNSVSNLSQVLVPFALLLVDIHTVHTQNYHKITPSTNKARFHIPTSRLITSLVKPRHHLLILIPVTKGLIHPGLQKQHSRYRPSMKKSLQLRPWPFFVQTMRELVIPPSTAYDKFPQQRMKQSAPCI